VWVSFLGIHGSPAHLRYLIQRLRRRLHQGVEIIVGLWPPDEAAVRDEIARLAIDTGHLTGSLERTVTLCVQAAIKAGETAVRERLMKPRFLLTREKRRLRGVSRKPGQSLRASAP
jgi:hypothetical protein